MRKVYNTTKSPLVPSRVIETFGRLIVQAQLNRIPVIASKVGGISSTLGNGGNAHRGPHPPFKACVKALIELLWDKDLYARLGRENAACAEFDPYVQVDKFLREDVLGGMP